MKTDSPFHQNPVMWLIVIVPLLAVVVGLSMLAVSIYTFDGPVVDDYYKKGKEINLTLARDNVASRYQLYADIKLDQNESIIEVALAALPALPLPESITLDFLHRTLAGKDQQVELFRNAAGKYTAPLPRLSKSRWLVELGTENWRLTGDFVWPVESTFELDSQTLRP